jgi:aryl-alcohol dehydrogenase-like predicted oxidoreductase
MLRFITHFGLRFNVQQRQFGHSVLCLPLLGLGAAQIGEPSVSDAQAARVLHAALDMGVTLIDTARSYGDSEARIGKHLAARRSAYTLSTKIGYGIPGYTDWTAEAISAGIDAALTLLKTDHIDIVHLHSCPLATLQAGDVVHALKQAREQGKLTIAAYSGENDALAWAVDSGHFGGVQCSVNLFDQASLARTLPQASARGMGVIAKRALGNVPWRYPQQPVGEYCEPYWLRMHALAYDTAGLPWDEFALRFAVHQATVSCSIVGTASVEHLAHNVALAQKGPLPNAVLSHIHQRFAALGAQWPGEI